MKQEPDWVCYCAGSLFKRTMENVTSKAHLDWEANFHLPFQEREVEYLNQFRREYTCCRFFHLTGHSYIPVLINLNSQDSTFHIDFKIFISQIAFNKYT